MKFKDVIIFAIASISLHLIFNIYNIFKFEYLLEAPIFDYLIPQIIYMVFLVSLLLFFIYLLKNQKKS